MTIPITGHFVRVQTNATWTAGPPNYIVVATDWQGLDQRCVQAIDGDKGGTWAPTTLITIAGQGLVCTGPTVVEGTGATLTSVASGTWSIVDASWPMLGVDHTGRSRTILSTTLRAVPNLTAVGPDAAYPVQPNLAYGSAQTVLVPGAPPLILMVPLRCHDGATLASVVVNWIVATDHNTVVPPKFRVMAVAVDGTCTPMSSTATGADANGFFSPTTSGASGWYNAGEPQDFEIPVDTLATISLANYSYFLEIDEEQGVSGFPWSAPVYGQSVLVVGAIPVVPSFFIAPSFIVDGVLISTSSGYVLLAAETDPSRNGLWLMPASSLPWIRVPLPLATGAIFFVHNGTQYEATYWQMAPTSGVQTTPLWSPNTAYTSGTTVAPADGGIGVVAVCGTGGTSSNSVEPSWPLTPGTTVTDGSVTWTMQNNSLPQPVITQMSDARKLNTGCGAGFAVFGNIWLPVACNFVDIQDCRWD